MAQTKELPKDLRKTFVDPPQAGKGYKTISKECGVRQSTVRLCTNGSNSRPVLISPGEVEQQRTLQTQSM